MSEGQEVTIVEQKPAEIVVGGKNAAKELTNIVSSRKKKLVMGGKQYLFFEDWQTIGKFYGVTAKVIHTEEIKADDALIGFMAQAVAVTTGMEVSAADAECTYDEPNWKNKPRFQLRSMAQTRACAKALRNCLGWVAVLAGYEPTPAEEMSNLKSKGTQKSTKPKPDIKQANKDVEDLWPEDDTPTSETNQIEAPVEGGIDIDRLKDSLKQLKWKEKTFTTWLKSKPPFRDIDTTGSLTIVVGRLNKEQREFVVKEIQSRLDLL